MMMIHRIEKESNMVIFDCGLSLLIKSDMGVFLTFMLFFYN